eukprot:7131582-Prymnesium_polylepis.1
MHTRTTAARRLDGGGVLRVGGCSRATVNLSCDRRGAGAACVRWCTRTRQLLAAWMAVAHLVG